MGNCCKNQKNIAVKQEDYMTRKVNQHFAIQKVSPELTLNENILYQRRKMLRKKKLLLFNENEGLFSYRLEASYNKNQNDQRSQVETQEATEKLDNFEQNQQGPVQDQKIKQQNVFQKNVQKILDRKRQLGKSYNSNFKEKKSLKLSN